MPGTYTGEYVVLRAPASGLHTRGAGADINTVREGEDVYLHPGHTVEFGNLTVSYPHNKQGRPFLKMETS